MKINIDLLEWAVEQGLRLGADEVEIFASSTETSSGELILASMPKISTNIDRGAGIRIVKDKRIGFSYLTKFEKEEFLKALKSAISSAAASKPLEDWKSLPEPSKYPRVSKLFDERIKRASIELITDYLNTLVQTITEIDKRVTPISTSAGFGYRETVIVNSHGLKVEETGTFIYAGAATMGSEGDRRTPICFDFDASRLLEINVEEIGKTATEMAVTSLKFTTSETEKSVVVFHPYALAQILMFTLTRVLSGDYIKRGISPFTDKLGEKIASDQLTIIDDGTLPGGLGSGISDDEGVPMQKKILVEEGVLRNFYFDNYTGKALGKNSTGNGLRTTGTGGASAITYATIPTPAPTNFIIKQGDIRLEEMLSEIKSGYFVIGVQGAHSSNPESGEFSVAGAPIWKIQDGVILGSAPGTMISGNLYELLKNIVFVSREVKKYGSYILPYVAIRNVNVISKK